MKFSVRDLLLVTVIAALAAGWGVDRTKLANEVREIQEERRQRLILESILEFGPRTGAPSPNPSKE